MRWTFSLLALGALVGWCVYRRVGWIRMETPTAELRWRAWHGLEPKYRRTQEANMWRLRLRRPRKAA